MFWVILTVICYMISSLGDKYISKRLDCSPAQFSFIVSFFTAIWLGLTLPFTGVEFIFSGWNVFLLLALAGCKILEFYTSALLLKTVSAYELKAWLGINILVSYAVGIVQSKYTFHWQILVCGIFLMIGIFEIVREQKQVFRLTGLFLLFILSKFGYGWLIAKMLGCRVTTTLFLVMVLVALIQLPGVKLKEIVKKQGLITGTVTRIPNAVGLFTESMAAMQSVFLYAMVQPIQLALLFIISLIKKEKMGKRKFYGSLVCILAVCLITVWTRK